MTVQELREILATVDPEMRVMLRAHGVFVRELVTAVRASVKSKLPAGYMEGDGGDTGAVVLVLR